MGYRQTYNRITRGGNANTYQHLGNIGKVKAGRAHLQHLANFNYSGPSHKSPKKFLAKLERQHRKKGAPGEVGRAKPVKSGKVVSRVASAAGVSGLARPLGTPKTTGRKAAAAPKINTTKPKKLTANRSKVAKLMAASNHAAANPTRKPMGLLRTARYAAAKLGRRISHVSRSFARHF